MRDQRLAEDQRTRTVVKCVLEQLEEDGNLKAGLTPQQGNTLPLAYDSGSLGPSCLLMVCASGNGSRLRGNQLFCASTSQSLFWFDYINI